MVLLKHTKENRDWTPKGFDKSNESIFLKIGKEFGCKFLIVIGSRAMGNYIATSDYDFIIVDDVSKNKYYRDKKQSVEEKLKVKLDFIVSNKVFPTNGIMLEIK